ncbi:MAG TPA: transglycosylase SLT domain-containing protein [Ignavibacteria bacterium]|nr:transglycosylase SLT domain-containing protein [Ignavibacteria bacterium]HMR39284.1 transglycosylase SLT domain-containing protein [Ignavibacteria bacterium]
MKKTFILTVPVVMAATLFFYSYNESSIYSKSAGELKEITSSEKNIVTSPAVTDKTEYKDFDEVIKKRSFDNNLYVENLLKDWPTLFDLFTSNANFKQKAKSINVKDLERINDKIQIVSKEFKLGNVDNLVAELGEDIKRECNYYDLDWRIVFAIIRQESYFNANARSHAGAFGLMQLMPRTGEGLQNQLSLEETQTPKNNVIAGIYYYATLVSQFRDLGEDKYKFALAAYNAGLGRVIDAMTITAYFEKDYRIWDNVKEAYPYLSSKEDSIHALVWPETKRPPYGTLDNWKEPYNYVNSIMFYYDAYKKMFESNLEEPAAVTVKKKSKKKKK